MSAFSIFFFCYIRFDLTTLSLRHKAYHRRQCRDPGSEFFSSRVLDPGSRRFPDPASRSASASVFKLKKFILSSRKYDPKCSSLKQIPGLNFFTHPGSRIPDPGVKKARIPVSGSATHNYCIYLLSNQQQKCFKL
jgi:hypothetical protein